MKKEQLESEIALSNEMTQGELITLYHSMAPRGSGPIAMMRLVRKLILKIAELKGYDRSDFNS